MPGFRTLGLAAGVAVVIAAYLIAWLHLAPHLAVGAGAIAAVVILLTAAALGEDPRRAADAWRRSAGGSGGRAPDAPGPHEPATWPDPGPDPGPDVPRG